MADARTISVCRGGKTAPYRLIWGCFANEGRLEWGRDQARKTFSATCYACYFREPEEALRTVVDFILSQQMDDGGFNCMKNRSGARHSSLHSTLSAVEGILEYARNGYAYRHDELQQAAARSREFILMHRLFRSDRKGDTINQEFLKLTYPPRWRYNILRALDHFRAAGVHWDERMADAIEVLMAKRRADGRWPQQAAHPGKVFFVMEPARSPSRWNTLMALLVLLAYQPSG